MVEHIFCKDAVASSSPASGSMSSLVFPFHDPKNIEAKFLKQILPILKDNFDNAFVSITPKTISENPESVDFLQTDSFFITNTNPVDSLTGDHFVAGYRNAVEHSSPDQILHLCNSDRIAFALQYYSDDFLTDLKKINLDSSPTQFLRSPKAWSTHPQNYFNAETLATKTGEILFNKTLDYTWCHLSLTARQLQEKLPLLTAKDYVVTTQLIVALKDIVITKEVDWLSWEDPYIFGKDLKTYKIERENDPDETKRRMTNVIAEINYLFKVFSALPTPSTHISSSLELD